MLQFIVVYCQLIRWGKTNFMIIFGENARFHLKDYLHIFWIKMLQNSIRVNNNNTNTGSSDNMQTLKSESSVELEEQFVWFCTSNKIQVSS